MRLIGVGKIDSDVLFVTATPPWRESLKLESILSLAASWRMSIVISGWPSHQSLCPSSGSRTLADIAWKAASINPVPTQPGIVMVTRVWGFFTRAEVLIKLITPLSVADVQQELTSKCKTLFFKPHNAHKIHWDQSHSHQHQQSPVCTMQTLL